MQSEKRALAYINCRSHRGSMHLRFLILCTDRTIVFNLSQSWRASSCLLSSLLLWAWLLRLSLLRSDASFVHPLEALVSMIGTWWLVRYVCLHFAHYLIAFTNTSEGFVLRHLRLRHVRMQHWYRCQRHLPDRTWACQCTTRHSHVPVLLPHFSHLCQEQHLLCSSPHHYQQRNSHFPLHRHLPLILLWIYHHGRLLVPLRSRFCFLDRHWKMRRTDRYQERCQ